MTNRYLIKFIYIILFIPNLCCPFTQQNKHMGSTVLINQSAYSLDQSLINAGYKIENIDNQAVLMLQNKPITAAEFYMPGIEGDKALKLYIEIINAMKNATIYLNNVELPQKTNNSGTAYIDLHRSTGKYYLKLSNSNAQITNNYYFELDKPLKLSCHGTPEFNCMKIYY